MILEVAILNVRQGEEGNFEQDFKIASRYISAIKGYLNHSLKKCVETKNQYILLVNWKDIESHEIGFRKSKEYLKWKELLHHYYDPFPIVEHYETVFQNMK
ncbi:Heme-degrading monooxygenase HmoA [Tenacibaculum sp. MAR_2009_124]|uniref:antibiotic biosynthesis monooxygenase family protein n=1 Tax=Tenacibaculum sp. MAR_2009_124 TaxID=1250059 RepID=UPI00089BA460|nr:antibiotic biosynthesis monooxygenase [Tenacibaculum sp. MAR_2009_124]SEC51583.1 Heme-degrading monooxygenase HmoA [Tenacibaculum sp. MAR_2009_124]